MYPWKDSLSAWGKRTGLRVDALGLVTILGTEEINASVGRFVPSRYVEFLPLLGAFVIAGNQFVKKSPGFTLYNATSGFKTTELSGWLSRWLKAQDFHQVHSKITWRFGTRPARRTDFWIGFVLIGLSCNGFLIALTVLTGDWWGFANAMSMAISVLVRWVLVQQNLAGIDNEVKEARKKHDKACEKYDDLFNHQNDLSRERKSALRVKNPRRGAKVIVMMDDSKVITMRAPETLLGPVFAGTPKPPNHRMYMTFRWVGWTAFAVHIISIGMATLATQILTVVILVGSTLLSLSKFGCDDSTMWLSLRGLWKDILNSTNTADEAELSCWIGSGLVAVCSEYSLAYEDFNPTEESSEVQGFESEYESDEEDDASGIDNRTQQRSVRSAEKRFWPVSSARRRKAHIDKEANPVGEGDISKTRTTRRQDLYVWLNLKPSEMESMKMWNLFPHLVDGNEDWWAEYHRKRRIHTLRLRGRKAQKKQNHPTNETKSNEGARIKMGGGE